MGIRYASREDVKTAMDMAETARADAQVDRLLDAASRSVEALTHRKFYPEHGTRLLRWPNDDGTPYWRVWLDADEVLAVDTLTSAGIDITEYFLEPQHSGPPYSRIEIDLSTSSAAFAAGALRQRSVSITGTFGACADTTPAGALAAGITDTATTLDVTDGSTIGVGDLLLLGTEYVQVVERAMVDTGQPLAGDLAANKAGTSVAVADGSAFHRGEVIRVDAERMLVDDTAPAQLFVRRAYDATVLAEHTSSTAVYASRRFTIARGLLGTTPAAHQDGSAVLRHTPPALVRSLTIDETIWRLQNERSGMARVAGQGENARQVNTSSITAAREDVYGAYGRKARKRAV